MPFLESTFGKTMIVMLISLVSVISSGAEADELGEEISKELKVSFQSPLVLLAGETQISGIELDAFIEEIPQAERAAFLRSSRRVAEAIERLTHTEMIASRALSEGYLDDPLVSAQLYASLSSDIAEQYLTERVESELLDDYTQRAREIYLAEPDNFTSSRTFDFTHVLVSVASRTEREAMTRILDIAQSLDDGAEFQALAREYSDDPSVEENGGSLKDIATNRLDANVARVLRELPSAGSVSGPVRSRFGWHLLRLDAVNAPATLPWEQAKEDAMQLARSRHRERVYRQLRDEIVDSGGVSTIPDLVGSLQEKYGLKSD